jgi:hypothetical protein
MAVHASTLGALVSCMAGIFMASRILSYFSTVLIINRNILTRLDSLLIATWMATIVVEVGGRIGCQFQCFQSAGVILTDLLGPFPEWLGWVWYLLVQFTTIMTISTTIIINMVRVFLIKKVTRNTVR